MGENAVLRLWESATGCLLASLRPLPSTEASPSEEWITHMPEGYYVASPGAARYVRWRVGPRLQSAGKYAEQYEASAVVAERLRCRGGTAGAE